MGLGQYNSLGEYCGLHTASSVFSYIRFDYLCHFLLKQNAILINTEEAVLGPQYFPYLRLSYIKADRAAGCQYDGQGVYCCLSTASEVFLISTTQPYSCLCYYNAIRLLYCQERSIATGILPTSNTPLCSLLD